MNTVGYATRKPRGLDPGTLGSTLLVEGNGVSFAAPCLRTNSFDLGFFLGDRDDAKFGVQIELLETRQMRNGLATGATPRSPRNR